MHTSNFTTKCGLSLRGYASPVHLLSYLTKFHLIWSLFIQTVLSSATQIRPKLKLKAMLLALENGNWTEFIMPATTHASTSRDAETLAGESLEWFSSSSTDHCECLYVCVNAGCMRKIRTEKYSCLFISFSPAIKQRYKHFDFCQAGINRWNIETYSIIYYCIKYRFFVCLCFFWGGVEGWKDI